MHIFFKIANRSATYNIYYRDILKPHLWYNTYLSFLENNWFLVMLTLTINKLLMLPFLLSGTSFLPYGPGVNDAELSITSIQSMYFPYSVVASDVPIVFYRKNEPISTIHVSQFDRIVFLWNCLTIIPMYCYHEYES